MYDVGFHETETQNASKSEESAGQLFIQMLNFYLFEFNPMQQAISIRDGGFIQK